MNNSEEVIVAMQLLEDRLEYYETLLGFLDENLPCLDVLLEQFEEQYYCGEKENGN